MSIETVHLRKLLQMFYAGPRQRQVLLRAEVRTDLAKEANQIAAGGDFYGPFWADAKEHAVGNLDLVEATKDRIEKNGARQRLYPILRDGFLSWWNDQRRWTNAPFIYVRAPTAHVKIDNKLTIKIEGMLSLRDAIGTDRYIYPYFSESPSLKNEGARIALWLFSKAFPGLNIENFRVLDVPRGKIFSPDRCHVIGDEETLLREHFSALWAEYILVEENLR